MKYTSGSGPNWKSSSRGRGDTTEPPDLARSRNEYDGDNYDEALLEQYKLYVQSAENISSNRIATSRYLLTLNAALLALYGLQLSSLDPSYLVLAIPVAGVLVSALWHRIIKSYGNLNSIKFELIHKLEERLPATLFKTEWAMVREKDCEPYIPVTKIEQWLPRLFAIAHGALAVVWMLGHLGAVWPA